MIECNTSVVMIAEFESHQNPNESRTRSHSQNPINSCVTSDPWLAIGVQFSSSLSSSVDHVFGRSLQIIGPTDRSPEVDHCCHRIECGRRAQFTRTIIWVKIFSYSGINCIFIYIDDIYFVSKLIFQFRK